MRHLNKQRGVVLMLVLWLLVLLTVMTAGYSRSTRVETLLAAHHVQAAQARSVAEAGIWLAIRNLLQDETERRWPVDGSTRTLDVAGGPVQIRILDQGGKIDLNAARAESLEGLLLSAGLDTAHAVELRNAILDWRDRDQLRRESGAEDAEYVAAGRDYGAKDGPFNSIEELRLVLGMDEDLFRKLAPALTVYSHQPTVNAQVAVREALLAVPQADPAAVDEFLARRAEEGTQNAAAASEGLNRRYVSGRLASIVSILSEGQIADTRATIEAVVRMRTGGELPFVVLSWREGQGMEAM